MDNDDGISAPVRTGRSQVYPTEVASARRRAAICAGESDSDPKSRQNARNPPCFSRTGGLRGLNFRRQTISTLGLPSSRNQSECADCQQQKCVWLWHCIRGCRREVKVVQQLTKIRTGHAAVGVQVAAAPANAGWRKSIAVVEIVQQLTEIGTRYTAVEVYVPDHIDVIHVASRKARLVGVRRIRCL